MTDYTLIILYSSLALGASFLCSILEAVLLSTTHSHIIALKDTHPKISKGWAQYKEDPERPLTAILTLNTIAHTVGALGVGSEIENNFEGEYVVAISAALLTLAILLLSEILPKTNESEIPQMEVVKAVFSPSRRVGILSVMLSTSKSLRPK